MSTTPRRRRTRKRCGLATDCRTGADSISVGTQCAPVRGRPDNYPAFYASFMSPKMFLSERCRNARAGVRVAVAASLGVVAGGLSSLFTFWQAAMLVG